MTARSLSDPIESVSVDMLFVETASTKPAGTEIDAALIKEPDALGWRVATTVNVAVPPESNVTGVFIDPVPVRAHDDPTLAEQVQSALSTAAGNVSVTVAATAVDGPLFDAAIVHVTTDPGSTPTTPLDLVIDRSPDVVIVSTSEAALLDWSGSVVPGGEVIETGLVMLPE